MDAELLELQKQFEQAQQAKSSIRLSERNVVELVQKLQELRIIDFDLLHTTSGKEYITPEQLRKEIAAEINKIGRVSVIDLADITGVDLYHVEKQAEYLVSNDSNLMLVNGEIITNSYWDGVAEEINERLQECSQVVLAEIAGQLQVGSEFILSVLEPRVGTLIKGRLEGGQLYTPAYVARVNAMVRGAARGVFVPLNLPALWNSLRGLLAETDGASGVSVDSSFFQSLFNGLVKEGEVLGSLRAGVHWTPTVFASAQKECVDSFFSQNSYIDYGTLQKLGIPQPVQYLQSRYPEGIALDTLFAHSSIIEMLDASAEDAIERGSWLDSLSVLPTSFSSQDASKVLSLCQSVQMALKSNKAIILGESYVFSNGFLKELFDQLEKAIETLDPAASISMGLSDTSSTVNNVLSESNETSKSSGTGKQAAGKGSKKKKGKSGNPKVEEAEVDIDDQEPVPTKSKKNQKKGKAASSSHVSDARPGSKKDSDKMKEDSLISEEWLIQKIIPMIPDLEEQGIDDPEAILIPLANHLRPMLINLLKERKKTTFTQSAQHMKRLMDNLQKKIDEAFLNIQLYEKALDLFEDDPSTSVLLHKHLLRTTATPMVDFFLLDLDMHNKMRNGIEVEDPQKAETSLSPGDRTALAKSFPGSLSVKALALVESLEAKTVDTFMAAARAMVEESGLVLKKLDKKLERSLLHSYRKDLMSQISAETDPVCLLPKVVSLLYMQIHGKPLQAPGRTLSIAVTRLKNKLDDSAFKILHDYQVATVQLLALMSAATNNDEDDCSTDRILSKKVYLEELMPSLKGLVLGSSQP